MGENTNTTDVEKSSRTSGLEDIEKGQVQKEPQLGDHSGCNGNNLERATSNPTVPTGDYANRGENPSEDSEDEDEPTTGLGRIMSRMTSRSSLGDPGPPPDGGRMAWAQCWFPSKTP